MAEQAYYAQYPLFAPNPYSTILANFAQLAITQHWRKGSETYKAQKNTYLTALAHTYISSIESGGAGEKLAALQGLCREVGIENVPGSITQCKKALQGVHVCIVDVIEHRRRGTPIRVFPSLTALREHIKSKGHYFPKQRAKSQGNGILRNLLREIG